MNTDKAETGTALLIIETANERKTPSLKISRPDAFFVTQLIATASGVEQTRALRRTAGSDAIQGYRFVSNRNVGQPKPAGKYVSLVA